MKDRAGMLAVNAAVNALIDEPEPEEGFHRGAWHRLPVGPYRVKYFIDGDVITIDRVDKVTG